MININSSSDLLFQVVFIINRQSMFSPILSRGWTCTLFWLIDCSRSHIVPVLSQGWESPGNLMFCFPGMQTPCKEVLTGLVNYIKLCGQKEAQTESRYSTQNVLRPRPESEATVDISGFQSSAATCMTFGITKQNKTPQLSPDTPQNCEKK